MTIELQYCAFNGQINAFLQTSKIHLYLVQSFTVQYYAHSQQMINFLQTSTVLSNPFLTI